MLANQNKKQTGGKTMLINIMLFVIGSLLAAILKSEADYANHD